MIRQIHWRWRDCGFVIRGASGQLPCDPVDQQLPPAPPHSARNEAYGSARADSKTFRVGVCKLRGCFDPKLRRKLRSLEELQADEGIRRELPARAPKIEKVTAELRFTVIYTRLVQFSLKK